MTVRWGEAKAGQFDGLPCTCALPLAHHDLAHHDMSPTSRAASASLPLTGMV